MVTIPPLNLILDAKFVQGTDITLRITAYLLDGTTAVLGDFVDITYRIRANYGTPVLFSASLLGGGITIANGVPGAFDVPMDNPFTATLVGTYLHEADLIDSLGAITPVTLCSLEPGVLTVRAAL